MKRILMIVGSLRKDSFNRQLALQVKEMLKGKAEVSFMEYADLPFMNQDIEFPAPPSVARVRREVQEADCMWIFSPEYNHAIPGVLKNALDWLSRPLRPDDPGKETAAKGKPVTITGVGGKSACAYARESLRGVLEFMSMEVLGGTGTGFSLDAAAYLTGILNLSEENRKTLMEQAELLLAE